jgi:hypothetical protein
MVLLSNFCDLVVVEVGFEDNEKEFEDEDEDDAAVELAAAMLFVKFSCFEFDLRTGGELLLLYVVFKLLTDDIEDDEDAVLD